MAQASYLIDESIIVYLDRAEGPYRAQLTEFLKDGELSHSFLRTLIFGTSKPKKHSIKMPKSSRRRLGGIWFFTARNWICQALGNNKKLNSYRQNAVERLRIAKKYVSTAESLTWWEKIRYRNQLLDLFFDANCKKSSNLQGKKLSPNEVIPFEMCEIALLARRRQLTLISYNSDYKYLTKLTGNHESQIIFYYADDFLKNYR